MEPRANGSCRDFNVELALQIFWIVVRFGNVWPLFTIGRNIGLAGDYCDNAARSLALDRFNIVAGDCDFVAIDGNGRPSFG